MRTFAGSLLLAVVAAQTSTTSTNSTSTVDKALNSLSSAWGSVKNWVSDITLDWFSSAAAVQQLANYNAQVSQQNATFWTHSLNATATFQSTDLGMAWIVVGMDLKSNVSAHWAAGSFAASFFQIQKPATSASRLLQAGSNWEGWMGVRNGTGNTSSGPARLLADTSRGNLNLWGPTNLSSSNAHWTRFGGNEATVSNSTSAWQLADDAKQTFTAVSNGTSVWHSEARRVLDASDAMRFKFERNTKYTGHAGHRYWTAAAGKAAGNATEWWTGADVTLMWEGASTTFLGLGAIAAITISMF